MNITQFPIPRRCNECKECLKPLMKGANYASRLLNGIREDFCTICWNDATKALQSANSNCQWTATIPAKKIVAEPSQTKQQQALELLRELLTSQSEEDAAEALVLALYLARKRTLLLRNDFFDGGQKYSLYEVNATEEMLPVKRLPLGALDVTKLQHTISRKLSK